MRRIAVTVTTVLMLVSVAGWGSDRETPSKPLEAIDLSDFQDSIHHWYNEYAREHQLERYAPHQVVEIADNMLRYQNHDGGWPKNIDWQVKLPPKEMRKLVGQRLNRSTLDNRTTWSQIVYLSKAYTQTGLERYRLGAMQGLGYILATQNSSGGWRGADVDAITYNDDVMTGVMNLLLDIRQGVPWFAWMEDSLRTEANAALDRAIAATLKCQIMVEGQKTAWCQQHSHKTYAPVAARAYELESICPSESTAVVRVLMRIPSPSEEIVSAIEAAVAWMEQAAIQGIRIEEIPMDPTRFSYHTARFDRVAVEDPKAPPIWARFYEIDTGRPFMCNRDGKKVYSLAEVKQERRTGYSWYNHAPASLIAKDYPAWKARQ